MALSIFFSPFDAGTFTLPEGSTHGIPWPASELMGAIILSGNVGRITHSFEDREVNSSTRHRRSAGPQFKHVFATAVQLQARAKWRMYAIALQEPSSCAIVAAMKYAYMMMLSTTSVLHSKVLTLVHRWGLPRSGQEEVQVHGCPGHVTAAEVPGQARRTGSTTDEPSAQAYILPSADYEQQQCYLHSSADCSHCRCCWRARVEVGARSIFRFRANRTTLRATLSRRGR